jgi:hypothetical protein
MRIDPVAAELRHIAFAIQRLGALRHRLDYDERLRISNLMRDVADDLDQGSSSPAHAVREGRRERWARRLRFP